MSNELIFLITAVGIFAFIRYCFFQGRRWLQASIVINLLLISVFGAKLIAVFGLVTNVGNIFYAMVFFAGQLLVEHYGKEEGKKSVWLGLAAVIFFVAIGQLTVRYTGIPEAADASAAIATLFKFTPRLALASMLAYLCAQSINVRLYSYLRGRSISRIWLRSLLSTAAGQLVDSGIFFTVAFAGVLPISVFFETMLVGWAVKCALGALSVPFLYSSYTAKTRREILESEAEAILHGIGDGLVMTDRQGKIVIVNKAFEELLGWRASEVVGKPMTEVLPRFDEAGRSVPFKARVLTRVLAGEKVETAMTNHTYFAKRDGTRFPVRLIVTPVLIDQAVMGAVEVFQDVTREKEIEKLRTAFLSLASHQLRTPLSGSRWIIETLTSGILGEVAGKQKAYLDNLYQMNARMIRLVNDMLNVLRVESGTVRINKEQFVLKKICDEVVLVMQAAAKEKDITLVRPSNEQEQLAVQTDFTLAKSIVAAFVSNAISYSPPGAEVKLGAEDKGDEIVFSVKDTGIGIPSDEKKRIFERFYRASNASLVKTDGTGLGLYIASVLAQKIGAKISFESKVGEGSTFSLHLPK